MQIFKAPLNDIKYITENNKLIIHEHSAMSNLLRNNRKKKIICYVLTNKNIIGWAWLISERGKYYSFMVYIKPKFRRNGYGSLLLEYVYETTFLSMMLVHFLLYDNAGSLNTIFRLLI